MKTIIDSTWFWLKKFGTWLAKYLLAPGIALIVVAVAILLVSMGAKELRIGGILGKLLGRKEPDQKATDIANTVPTDRIDSKGNLIPIGVADDNGFKQVVVTPVETGLFSDPSTVTITPPGEEKPIVVELPKGVVADNVDQVVIVTPTVTAVTVKDSSGITVETLDDILAKYQ